QTRPQPFGNDLFDFDFNPNYIMDSSLFQTTLQDLQDENFDKLLEGINLSDDQLMMDLQLQSQMQTSMSPELSESMLSSSSSLNMSNTDDSKQKLMTNFLSTSHSNQTQFTPNANLLNQLNSGENIFNFVQKQVSRTPFTFAAN